MLCVVSNQTLPTLVVSRKLAELPTLRKPMTLVSRLDACLGSDAWLIDYHTGVAPHCPLGPLAFAASLQVGFATSNFVICEMSLKVCLAFQL